MWNRRRIGLAVPFAMLLSLYAVYPDRCAAQKTNTTDTKKDTSKTPQDQTGGAKTQTPQAGGPIVAGPGSTVVAPAANPANPGLIVAAPGATVVIQQVQPANQPAKTSTASKTNSFSSKTDLSTIDRLGAYAKDTNSNNFRARAGAIDALGFLGAGADQATINAIVKNLTDVLEAEFINSKKGALKYGEAYSEFLCFHVVQAVGNLGWGARCALPQLQLLRGGNPILDAAIDHVVSAMQNSPAPPNPGTTTSGSPMTPNTPDSSK